MDARKTLAASLAASLLLILVGILSGNAGILGNAILAAVMIMVMPFFLRKYAHYRWVRAIEDQFPNFVRDLADSRRSGMSFSQSVRLATKGNYGRLTPEIRTMHNKLSWGIPFLRVLDLFQQRVRSSRLLAEALTIIKESYQAGGDIASTLATISQDMLMLKESEAERVSMVKQNVMIMYGIYFMFVGIAIMIIFVMIPIAQNQPLVQSGSFGFSFDNPCDKVVAIFPCPVYNAVASFLGVPPGIGSYYISIFFIVVVILGLFTGLIAGQLGENSVTAGGKHALLLTFVGIGIFFFLARTGLLPS